MTIVRGTVPMTRYQGTVIMSPGPAHPEPARRLRAASLFSALYPVMLMVRKLPRELPRKLPHELHVNCIYFCS